ncbi:MAG: DEAD/DEAH box helicase [Rhizobiales bacterium]|nr:DEAD/DEAH box helicase [Hyphomicrobiales bacterium]
MTSFQTFGLAEPISRALADEQYVRPTPIQSKTIPTVLTGRDLIGIAQTGTGKTAAFALPLLHRLSLSPRHPEKKSCRVLVLSPTRELSAQILDSFNIYGKYLRVRSTLAIGGVSMGKQVRALMHGVDILVATPGRLLDLVQSNALRLSHVEALVLDEADRMLDMGFIHDVRKIVAKLPIKRQTLLFSATMPREITELAAQMLRDPETAAVTPQATTVERIDQRIIHLDRAAKPAVLAELLRSEPIDRALVFTRTKHGADKVVRSLEKAGIAAEAIHGNKSQPQRERVLAAFRDGKVRTLIATDIAARGIDVTGISHVFNYDLPNIPESYVHRIGRTARAGADGVAISFCDAEEKPYLRDIEKLIRLSIPATDRRGARPAQAPQPKSEWRPEQQRNGKQHRRPRQQQANGRHQPNVRDTAARDSGARPTQADQNIGGVAFMQRKSEPRVNRDFKSVHRAAR